MAETPNNLSAVPPEKSGGGKLWKILTIVLFLITVALAVIMFTSKSNAPSTDTENKKVENQKEKEVVKNVSVEDIQAILEVKPIVVNLADAESSRYIRLGLNIGVSDKKLTDKYENDPLLKSEIKDTIISVLSSKTSAELLSPKGKNQLKKDLKKALNEQLKKNLVKKIFFTDFIVQL